VHAVLRFLWHWLIAVNEHSLHSPFLFNLYTKTIKRKIELEDFNAIEQLRKELSQSKEKISITQLGANSKVSNQQVRAISEIARKGISSKNTSELLYKIIQDFDYNKIVELGTSLGINTLYLATRPAASVYTFEGCPETIKKAKKNFAAIGYANINLIEGNIDVTLPEFCHQFTGKIDLAFIDANHKYETTLAYFNQLLALTHPKSTIVIDDIYWSGAMATAWKQIKNHPQVTTTIDLYNVGIVIFRPELQKEHISLMA